MITGLKVMRLLYYPGCTLHEKARGFDLAGRWALEVLGVEVLELQGWVCCGAAFPLVKDDLISLVGPIHNLALAGRKGESLATSCAFCYHVLKRANRVVRMDPEGRRTLNLFLEEEYGGEVEVKHLLEVLRDYIGFSRVTGEVVKELEGLRVAPYYGCQLLRPSKELELDDPERPRILEDLLESLGCEVVDFPSKTECCGSYLSISSSEIADECSSSLLSSAASNHAEMIVVSCPLCQYNLDESQPIPIKGLRSKAIPILYFTQLLGLALGIDPEICDFQGHRIDPRPLLREKGIIS